ETQLLRRRRGVFHSSVERRKKLLQRPASLEITRLPEKSYIRECQETFLSVGSVPILFLSRHSAQLVERALPLREWSCSGSCFVSVCEAEERFLFAVVPYPRCGGAIRLLKHQA